MIDTIRFRIDLSPSQLSDLSRVAKEFIQIDHENHRIDFSFLKVRKPLGSFSRSIAIDIDPEASACFLEFSLPKFLLGHNLYLLDPDRLPAFLESVHSSLSSLVPSFPAPFFWEYARVDFCYAWKFPDDSSVLSLLSSLSSLSFSRKKTYKYDTSLMFVGSSYSVKFYAKHEEFYAHDFKELRRKGLDDLAFSLLEFSRGVLRFEVSARSDALHRFFSVPSKSPLFLTHSLTFERCTALLSSLLAGLLRLRTTQSDTKQEAVRKLLEVFSPQKALRLYSFFLLWYSKDFADKEALKMIDRSTIWRNLKDLERANVGILTDSSSLPPLAVPSPYTVPFYPTRRVADASPSGTGAEREWSDGEA